MPRTNHGPQLRANKYGVYEIRWTEGGRSHRVSTRTQSLQEARAIYAGWLTEYETDREKGPADPTVQQIMERYRDGHVRAGKVADLGRSENLIANIIKGLGHLRVSEITDNAVRVYGQKRLDGAILGGAKREGARARSPGTVRLELGRLVAALNWARKRGQIERVPHVELPEASPPRDRWLTEEEVRVWLDQAERETARAGRMTRMHRWLVLALGTGSRTRAIETLVWSQIDLQRNVIRFDVGVQRRTKKRRVGVPIAGWLRPWIERMQRERVNEYVLDDPGEIKTSFNSFRKRLIRQTGRTEFADVTRHVMRHTAGTRMASAGVPLWEIAGILGDSMQTVLAHYAHHAPEHLRRGVEALDPGGSDWRKGSGGVG